LKLHDIAVITLGVLEKKVEPARVRVAALAVLQD
jgi:hypothetical protein